MNDPASSSRRVSPKLVAWVTLGALALALGLSLDREPRKHHVIGIEDPGSIPALDNASGSVPETPARAAADSPVPSPRLADGLLPPLLGPPRGANASFCDDSHWSRLGTVLREFRDGEVLVNERDWVSRAAEARIGIASWVSKCKQSGAPVKIRGDESGRVLAIYDSQEGYRRMQSQ